MWDDEQELRGALRAELARQAPPARSGLSDVLASGRRRRWMRQAGVVVAVLATLTGTGAAITALSEARVNRSGEPAAAVPTTSRTADPAGADWPKAELPTRTPYTTWRPAETAAPPPDRAILGIPLCDIGDTAARRLDVGQATDQLRQRLRAALTAVAGSATVGEFATRRIPANPDKAGSVDTYDHSADISDANGTGSMRLTVGDFTGDPVEAADREAFDLFNCQPPKRLVLATGTVLQLYPVYPSEPFQSLTQALRIYLPDGTRYQLEAHNFGSPDFAPNPDQPQYPNRVGAGRETLPLTEQQLAAVAEALARAG
jgi:hypothetical protein